MTNFTDFNLSVMLQESLEKMGYDTPTPIQAQAIPIALKGRDIMGSAQTGTGKTAAYAIPIIEKLLTTPNGSALILTPTRELGKQVMDIMHQLLGKKSPINTAFLIGGVPMGKQYAQLTRKPRLIVGTPGRINDHLDRGNIHMKDMKYLVLDETDRMLDMGFSVQIDAILEHMPKKRQTLMFSATLPDDIIRMSKNYLYQPERVAVGSLTNPIENIKQDILHIKDHEKYDKLVEQLNKRAGSIIIFVKTKYGTERLAKRLNNEKDYDFVAGAIHGDLKQTRRDRVIKKMRKDEFRILVATDVVARGLDIPHIEHVINYDLPQVPEDYIHRIGRTARAGAKGFSLCLITPHDKHKWHEIEMLMDPETAITGGKVYRGQGDGKKRRRPNKDRPRRGSKPDYAKKRSPGDRFKKKKTQDQDNNDFSKNKKRIGVKKRNNERHEERDENRSNKAKFKSNQSTNTAKKPKKKNTKSSAKANSKGGVKTGKNTGYRKRDDNAPVGARKNRPFNRNKAKKVTNKDGNKPRTAQSKNKKKRR